MKKLFLTIVAAITVVLTGFAADKYTLERSALPEVSQEFLETHFPRTRVGMIKIDSHLLKKTDYDVRLVDGTKIEFSNSGGWKSVDCKSSAVPESIIPKAIRTYMDKNFAAEQIVKIEKKTSTYEITLSDGVDITFNRLGQFKKFDLEK